MSRIFVLSPRLLALMQTVHILLCERWSLMGSFDVLAQSFLILMDLLDTRCGPRVDEIKTPPDSRPQRRTSSCSCRPTVLLSSTPPNSVPHGWLISPVGEQDAYEMVVSQSRWPRNCQIAIAC